MATYRTPPVGGLTDFEREVIRDNRKHSEVNRRLAEAGLTPIDPERLPRLRQLILEHEARETPVDPMTTLLKRRVRVFAEYMRLENELTDIDREIHSLTGASLDIIEAKKAKRTTQPGR